MPANANDNVARLTQVGQSIAERQMVYATAKNAGRDLQAVRANVPH